jgi:hypothetical protein
MLAPPPSGGVALRRRPRISRRVLLHAIGLVLAGLLTWLVWRGYRQPDLLLDLSNLFLIC